MKLTGIITRSGAFPGTVKEKKTVLGQLGMNPSSIPVVVDHELSLSSTNPVQNKVITAAITNRLWSDEVKAALLQIVEKVAYIDADGQDYYDALYDALYPPTNLDSIGAVFDSSATIYNTDTLDDLKQYLVVTAYYTSGDSEVVTTYTLSGSMDAGTQTITVSYGGKSTTFTVTVVEWVTSISAVFTQGSATIYNTDTLDTLKQYLTVTASYADGTSATVAAYTLSGTLEVGTSTITASYGGKTSTFTVTVTSGFLYTAANGLLSEQPYITLYGSASTSLDPFTETLTSDGTRIQCPKQSSVNGRAIYKFDPNILDGDGKMIVEFKVVDIGWYSSSNTSGDGVFGMEIADSSNGSDVGICRIGSSSATPKFRTRTAANVTSRNDVSLNAWHTIEIRYENGKQTTILDGTNVLTNADPSNTVSLWGAYSYITFTQSNTNALDFYIRKVEFAAY